MSVRDIPPGYHRVKRGRMAADQFTQISNALFRDPRLSAKAMGVFGHISTHQNGYGVTPESISRHMRDGVSAIKGALRELEECGYLVRTRERRPDGTLGGVLYEITDEPEETIRLAEEHRRSGDAA
jgi:DNA-binding transcriptional ArsR family regulator